MRRAFTLVELLMGMMITTMLSTVLGAMMVAVTDGWDHTTGLDDATQQARIGMERIGYMVSQAGVYQLPGQPTIPGLAVVQRPDGSNLLPEILVVWSGGPTGGMSAAGMQSRLPLISELVIYAPQASNPSRLVEITSPANMASIDFSAPEFGATILAIVAAPPVTPVLLCDRLHVSSLGGGPFGGAQWAGNARFEIFQLPSDASLAGVVPGSTNWNNLVWSQGIVSSSFGLRQATLRMELQLEPRPLPPGTTFTGQSVPAVALSNSAIPFIGSASFPYAYSP